MTEDELVAAIRAAVENPEQSGPKTRTLVAGIGDDAAAWRPSRSHLSVVTSDALIDGVHFLRDSMTADVVGARAMAANLSDLAAMGARPRLATVALGLDASVEQAWVVECYRAMAALCARFGAVIAGGDIVRSPALTLAITAIGEVAPSRLKRRSGGRPGDVLAVSGPLGASRAGLEVLRRPELAVAAHARADALATFMTPRPRVPEGRWLAASTHVRAMMDLSDGLSTDAPRLALASGCGLTIEHVPVHEAALEVARAAGADARTYALDGGEDFELLVAVAPRAFAHLARRFETRFGKPLLRVGTLDAERGARLRENGAARELVPAGYDHLKG